MAETAVSTPTIDASQKVKSDAMLALNEVNRDLQLIDVQLKELQRQHDDKTMVKRFWEAGLSVLEGNGPETVELDLGKVAE